MPHITDEQLNELLQNIPDEGLRSHYQMVASGQIKAAVYCLRGKKPMKIGEQMHNDAWISTARPNSRHGLQSYRHRFDGLTGFSCTCGNRSIVAEAEEGHISGVIPTRTDLEKIHAKLQKNKTKVQESGAEVTYDGFRIVNNTNTLVGIN